MLNPETLRFEPHTRRERVLLKACEIIAEKANADLMNLIVRVAIAQADDQEPPAPEIEVRVEYRLKEMV